VVGHKLYMDNFFSSSYLVTCIQDASTIVELSNHKEMTEHFDNKTPKLKQGDICARVRGNLAAIIWKDVRICTDHQQKATLVTNIAKLKSMSLMKTMVSIWAMSTQVTEWLIVIQLVTKHGSGGNNCFTSWA